MMTKTIELPFVYRFDEVMARLALDPLNAVDLSNYVVKVPLDQAIISVQCIGSFQEPKFNLIGIESEEQLERIMSIFHFHKSLDSVNTHFAETN